MPGRGGFGGETPVRESLERIVRTLAPREESRPDPALFGAMLENLAAATGALASFLCGPASGAADASTCAVFPPDESDRVRGLLAALPVSGTHPRRGVTVTTLPDATVSAHAASLRREGVSSSLTVALVDPRGALLGYLGLLTGDPDALGRPMLAVLEAFGAQIVAEIERARAEAELERERAYFKQLLDTASDGIAILDSEDRIVDVNRCFTEIFGYEASEIRDRPIDELIVPEVHREAASLLSRESREGRVVQSEGERRRKDGVLVPVSILAYPVILQGRQVGVLAAYRDITARRAAEAALRASERKYRTLFEKSKDVIYISSPEGKLLDINPAGVELFEYASLDEMLRADIVRDFYVDPVDRDRLIRALEERGFVLDFETVLRTHTGRRLIVQDTCIAEKDDEGRLVAYRGFLRDVTGQRDLEEQLRHSRKMEALGRIAGGVAHDFNNLLMGVEGFASVLAGQLGASDPRRADADEIRRLARLGGQITRKLLAFSRQQVLALAPVDLNALVRDVEGFLDHVLGEGIVQQHRLGTGIWPVRADAGQLEQVLVNLALNARDAMPKGGRLEMRTENVASLDERAAAPLGLVPGEYVKLTVADTGIGMTAAIRERIFEPFFTTKAVGKGSGLGLAIVYGIVRQSGGAIHAHSEPGHGSRFEIYLPREVSGPSAHRDPVESPVPDRLSGTVLIAEDEITVRVSLKRYLEDRGFVVIDAADGASALALARAHRGSLDVLVADVAMPGMRGTQLASRLRRERPGIRVIYMSGYLDVGQESDHSFLDAPVLEKPFPPDLLVKKIQDLLV